VPVINLKLGKRIILGEMVEKYHILECGQKTFVYSIHAIVAMVTLSVNS